MSGAGAARGGRRLRDVAAAAAVAALAAGLLTATPTWRLVDARLYDLAVTLVPPTPPDDLVIVAIDEPSFSDVGIQWPWPRSLHGQLVEALRAAGAKAIGLDLIFAEPSADPAEDDRLAAALGPDVVLAADETLIETPQASSVIRTEPLPALTANGARAGLASVLLDGDGAVRRMPPYEDSFARVLATVGGETAGRIPPGAMVRPFGPARTVPTVSYYQALDPQSFLPPRFFDGKVVLVGLSLQSAASAEDGGADAFASSFTTLTNQLTPGVEVQATLFDALRSGRLVTPLSPAGVFALVLAAAGLAGAMVLRSTTWRTVLAGALVPVGLVGASGVLLTAGSVWVSPAAPAIAALMTLAIQAARDFVAERRMRQMVTRAFQHYLAPDLVDRLARDPAALKLGGERRTLTILFCDVRGFTSIAERMKDDPERLTSLINQLLDPLSAEVLKRGGTIDKYIGDCVMAFWNAPLDDPDHAVHAVEAALAMVEAAAAFDRKLSGERDPGGAPLPAIAVGVGVNTGDCVVGNMGSSARFDYSVLGDAVNLASRLEGASKDYGVAIVLGAETRARVEGRFPLITLDRIAVRGRSERAPVSTPLPAGSSADAETLALHEGLVADLVEDRLAGDDPRFATLAERLPMLAGYYRRMAERIAAKS